VNGGRVARRSAVLFLVCSLWAPSIAAAPSAEAGSRIYALLINGGDRPVSNYQSHLHHLQDMVGLLRARGVPPGHIHVFSADGQDPAPDLTTRWTMTSSRGVPLTLVAVRPGGESMEDLEFEATVVLRPTPGDLPNLAGPPSVGDRAPVLPSSLRPVGARDLPDLLPERGGRCPP
jgi:hypothetical protein